MPTTEAQSSELDRRAIAYIAQAIHAARPGEPDALTIAENFNAIARERGFPIIPALLEWVYFTRSPLTSEALELHIDEVWALREAVDPRRELCPGCSTMLVPLDSGRRFCPTCGDFPSG